MFSFPNSLEQHPGTRPDDGRASVAVGVTDEDDGRDTIQLHKKEEVTSRPLLPPESCPWDPCTVLLLLCKALPSFGLTQARSDFAPLSVLRRTSCATTSSKGRATSGWKGSKPTARSGKAVVHGGAVSHPVMGARVRRLQWDQMC